MGGFGETRKFRTAKFVPFRHQRWPPRWAALRRHGDSELLNHFVTISVMVATAAILKIFSCQHMPWSVDQCPSPIRMSVNNVSYFRRFHQNHILDSCHGGVLKVFNCYLLPIRKPDGAETWWKALGKHGDIELLKWFRSDIQNGHIGSHLEYLQIFKSHLLSNGKSDWALTWWEAWGVMVIQIC